MVLCFFVLLFWFIEFVKFFDIHKMDWIVQKWPTIPTYMSKFYIIKYCQAFLAVKSSFKSHCLYAYSYFCDLKHSKPDCRSIIKWYVLFLSILYIGVSTPIISMNKYISIINNNLITNQDVRSYNALHDLKILVLCICNS